MNTRRYRRILAFFAFLLIKFGFLDIFLPRIGLRRLSLPSRPHRLTRAARDFRVMAVDMGGVMIKVGQFLSARLDILPKLVTDELAGLQDEVKAESFTDIRRVIESEFNQPLEAIFEDFQSEPLASASIGQVHIAKLKVVREDDPEQTACVPVVVKVQRPDIQSIIETDLAALDVVTGWLERYRPLRKHANIKALLQEFSNSIHLEMDYLNEGKNADTFRNNFVNNPQVLVPKVYWQSTTLRVLTLEDVLAIKITDYQAIEAAGINRAEVASVLLDTYLKQVFEDRFFHADPHPGNLFVFPQPDPTDDAPGSSTPRWKLIFVDFGMAGEVHTNIYAGLREMLAAFGTQDAARIVKSYRMLDVLLPGADLELLEKAERKLLDHLWGKSIREMMKIDPQQAHEFVHEFRELLYDMPFQIPENLILLGRSLAILSGICTGLDPQFNVWTRMVPYARKLIEEESGWEFWFKEFSASIAALVRLPLKTEALFKKMEQGQLEVKNPELSLQLRTLNRSLRRLTAVIFTAMFFLGGVQVMMEGYQIPGTLLLVAAGIALLWSIFRR